MEKVPMTQTGFIRMEEELKRLKGVERPSIIQALEEARAHGDLSENAEYHAAVPVAAWLYNRRHDRHGGIFADAGNRGCSRQQSDGRAAPHCR